MISKNKVYTCSISTNNGTIFKNGSGSTTLTAYAYNDGVDVSGNLEIRWSKDGTKFYVGKSVTVNAEDVDVKAVYSFTAYENGVKRGYYEVTITDVMDGEDGKDGQDGIPGTDGADGKTTYFHVKYSAIPNPTFVNVWAGVGYYMVIILAGLTTIPDDVYEAAAIDGATSIQKFFKITVPMLKPILAMCILMDIIGSVKVFDLVFAMTGGGPNGLTNLPTTLMYNEAFKYNHYGVGSAIGIIIMVICIVGTVGSNLITNRKKAE